MDQRINELAMRANDQTGNEFDLNYAPLYSFLEKFAELLLADSAQPQYEDNRNDGGDFCLAEFQQHFGVKE